MSRIGGVGLEDFAEPQDELVGGPHVKVAGQLPDLLENLLPWNQPPLVLDEER